MSIYDKNAKQQNSTDLDFECAAKSLGEGKHVLIDSLSGLKRLVLRKGDMVIMPASGDVPLLDEYDGDDYY